MSRIDAARSRSLADDLRARSDAELAALLRARPDLVSPMPVDLGALAARAATPASVARALERVDAYVLQVVDVLCVLPEPASYDEVTRLLGADPDRPLERLRTLGLLFGEDGELRLVRPVRELVGALPAGLGPPLEVALGELAPSRLPAALEALGLAGTPDPPSAVAALRELLADAGRTTAIFNGAPPGVHGLLDRLTWGPPAGELAAPPRVVSPAQARTPVEWLVSRCLLGVSGRQVLLPLDVGLHLRGGRVHPAPLAEPPAPTTVHRGPDAVDRSAGGQAFTALRRVEELLEAWSTDGPAVLRSGGLGVREVRRSATALNVDEPTLVLVAELAYGAGLVGPSGEIDDRWLPTPAYDLWRVRDAANRWWALASAWLESTRVPALAGVRDDRDKPFQALGPDLDRSAAPDVRREALRALAALPPGAAADAASLAEVLDWHHPHRSALRRDLLGWAVAEADALGVTGLGALAAPGRALLAGDEPAAVAALGPLLPQLVDHVLLQADLTAVAPGPLTAGLGAELALAADIESRGGATVYRFSAASVRRALDAGRTAEELHTLLARHSSTPVPQPLSYLVDDVARRHGRLRVGTASAYLRCDDDAILGEILADKRSQQLGVRRLAATVLVAQAGVETVLARVREMGFAPAAESATGDVLIRRLDARRTSSRMRPPRLVTEPAAPAEALLSAAVRALRAGERVRNGLGAGTGAGRSPGAALPRLTPAETLGALRSAAISGDRLWIGYVNAEGRASQRVIEPISVEGGFVRAFDHLQEELRTFSLHRITGVSAAQTEQPA